jgi:hypothetical protein
MSDFEQWLQRYRPVGPPPGLRRFEPLAYPRRARIVDWLPVIAVAALILLFSAMAASIRSELAARLPMPPEPIETGQQITPSDEMSLP